MNSNSNKITAILLASVALLSGGFMLMSHGQGDWLMILGPAFFAVLYYLVARREEKAGDTEVGKKIREEWEKPGKNGCTFYCVNCQKDTSQHRRSAVGGGMQIKMTCRECGYESLLDRKLAEEYLEATIKCSIRRITMKEFDELKKTLAEGAEKFDPEWGIDFGEEDEAKEE